MKPARSLQRVVGGRGKAWSRNSRAYTPMIRFRHASDVERTPNELLVELEGMFKKQGVQCLSNVSQEWFASADKSHRKEIDFDDFTRVFESVGLGFRGNEAKTLFDHFNKDGSGSINYSQFVRNLRGPMPEFSASLAFMHQHTGHFPSNLAKLRSTRPQFDLEETEDWLESLDACIEHHGHTRTRFLLHDLVDHAHRHGVPVSKPIRTPMVNSIPEEAQEEYPGDLEMERKILNIVRWNAAVMVSDANKRTGSAVGGHIGTFASVADIFECCMNHFFRGKDFGNGHGDSIYMQGHAAPGAYSRSFVEGRLSMERIMNFRQEALTSGVSSYPHPRLMPDYWENPTVSMGLGPLQAVYQARFFRYLHLRGLANTSQSRVWCFIGDGESDEPETVTAISVAGRERLNNLIMIVNCNYQRLDGPVRGNSKVIQEFEGVYRGAGFDVIKLIWGTKWNELIRADYDGRLIVALDKTPDGDCQRLHAKADGALIRRDIFEKHGLLDRVAHWSDDELLEAFSVPGGHDHAKIYNAMAAAERNAEMGGRPTVILAKTLKGFSLQKFLGRNTVHQKKVMDDEDMQVFRTAMGIPLSDEQLTTADSKSLVQPGADSPEVTYMRERRMALGGYWPERRPLQCSTSIELAPPVTYEVLDAGSKGRAISTTMAFAQILRKMMTSGEFGKRCTLMVTDESRTFGIDAFFPIFKIHAPFGQNYTPVDADQMMKYAEAPDGQILQEGISEGGAIMTWICSATSYASQQAPTMPFLIYYSMFGFQRVFDSIWQAADMRARGFLMGATHGRTTLNGEGLQHQDGHSLLIAHTCPAVKGWDPAFGYEMARIIRHGVDEMWGNDTDVIYYVTAYNENYPQPPKPEGIDDAMLKGLYKFKDAKPLEHTARLIGSGAIMAEVLGAVEILEKKGIGCEIWSATSYSELQREALDCERSGRMNPGSPAPTPYVAECLGDDMLTVAASDNMKAVPKLIERWVGGRYIVLGTDGFGRSDTRAALRRFFEVDKEHIAAAAISGLVKTGKLPLAKHDEIMKELGLSAGPRVDVTSIEKGSYH